MNKESIKESSLVFLRAVLMALGGYLTGSSFLGNEINGQLWEGIVGIVLSVAAVTWSIVEKTATIERVEGVIRQSITFFGSLLVSSGRLSHSGLQSILLVATTSLPFVQSMLTRKKAGLVGELEPNKINS